MAVVVDVATAVRSDKSSRQVFAGRAGLLVLFGVVDEVLPGEQAALGVARCQGLWHTGQHASVLARQYLIAVEITPISQNSNLLVSCRLLRPECRSCVRSWPTLVTSCATIRWCSTSTAVCTL